MEERQNAIVYAFDPSSPRITAHQSLRLPESDIRMIQIEIESHGSGNVGHNSEHNGDKIFLKYENPRHPLYEHDQSIGTEELICGDGLVAGASTRSLLQRAKSQQMNPLCPHIHVSPRVVHRTDISDATDL